MEPRLATFSPGFQVPAHSQMPIRLLECAVFDRIGGDPAYLGRKPSFTREQFNKVREMLGQQAVGIAQIAKETGLTRQTVYRIKGDPAGAEGALVAWGL